MDGLEAYLCLQYLLDGDGILEDPAVDYLSGHVEEMDAAALLEAMGLICRRLRELEAERSAAPAPKTGMASAPTGRSDSAAPERIRITRDYRILLPDRFDTEIRLRPLVKTVFLLFLRHPEGIRFGDLPAYREEMADLYGGISRRGNREEMERSIDRLIDPRDNSIHEKASALSATLARYFPPEVLPQYTLSGKAGTPKRIPLDRLLVEWE